MFLTTYLKLAMLYELCIAPSLLIAHYSLLIAFLRRFISCAPLRHYALRITHYALRITHYALLFLPTFSMPSAMQSLLYTPEVR